MGKKLGMTALVVLAVVFVALRVDAVRKLVFGVSEQNVKPQ